MAASLRSKTLSPSISRLAAVGGEIYATERVLECRFVAMNGHPAARNRLPLYPQLRTFRAPRWTSACDPQETFGPDRLAQPATVNSSPSRAWEGTVVMAAKRIQRTLAVILAADVVG